MSFKKTTAFILCVIVCVCAVSCSVQGESKSGVSGQTINFSNVEKAMSTAIQENVPVQPCQGVPNSGVMWPKEFMFACTIYDHTVNEFNNGFLGDGVTQTSPYNCNYTAYTSTRSGLSGSGYHDLFKQLLNIKYAPNTNVFTLYDNTNGPGSLTNITDNLNVFRQNFFDELSALPARIKKVNYLIVFGNKFKIETGKNNSKYLKLNTPIERDSSDLNSVVGKEETNYKDYNIGLNTIPQDLVYKTGLLGAARPEIQADFRYFPLELDKVHTSSSLPSLSFNLTAPGINNYFRRFIYPVVFDVSDTLPLSPYDNDPNLYLNFVAGRMLCSFVIKDKFYKIKKSDFTVFLATFKVPADELTLDADENITIAVPTLYYQTAFKPRTIVNMSDLFAYDTNGNLVLPSGYSNSNTKSTGMNEGGDFTAEELSSPTSQETSYANIFEKKENGSVLKKLPSGMQETESL